MQITGAAVANVNKISGFLSKFFNKTAKVNIGLISDGNAAWAGNPTNFTVSPGQHGWEMGIVESLNSLNLNRYGTGIVGCAALSVYNPGHGHIQQNDFTNKNDIPVGVTTSNGFTANMPSEWVSYLSNWGTAIGVQGAVTDDATNSIGVLQPYGVTTANSVASGSWGYVVNGNEDWGTYFSRPFEGITSQLNLQLWYLKSNQPLTGGSAKNTRLTSGSAAGQYQVFQVVNINATAAAAAGATFSFTIGATTTPGIAYSLSTSTLQNNIKAAITAADVSFQTWNPTITVPVGILSGDMIVNISGTTFPSNNITLNYGGLTHRYYDATYAPGLTTFKTQVPYYPGYLSYLSGISLSSGGQQLNATGPAHLARRDYAFGPSANNQTSVRLIWSDSLSGPWCSMFCGTNISGATQGYAVSSIVDMGGQSARRQLIALRKQSNQFLGSVFQALAEHAGYTSPAQAPLLLRVNGGVFDANDGFGSTGPSGGIASNTQAGLRDNWQGIINRVHDAYAANGWTTSNLYWLFTASPPTTAGDSNLNFARLAAIDVSNNNDRVAAVNLFTLNGNSQTDMNALSNIASGGSNLDTNYNSYTGYRVYSQVEWNSIQAAYNAGGASGATNTAPIARFTWSPLSPQAAQGQDHAYVTVNASTSTDSETLSGASYSWSWYDESISGELITTNGITAYISLPVGSNAVGLDVTDAGGSAGSTSGIITVLPYSAPPAPGSPTATITAVPGFTVTDNDDNGSETILFSGAASTSPNGAITNYAWSKNGVSTGATGVTTSMLFTVTGTNQTVGLMVTDISGNTASALQYITVNRKPTGPGAVSNSTTVWFGGKVLTTEQYIKVLEAFYPNLLR